MKAAWAPASALILTIYGSYARETGGWLSVSHLVRLMAVLGVDAAAVRVAVSRLKRRGILEARRLDGRPGYALTPDAGGMLARGDRRIFAPRQGSLEDGWVLVVFSIPETQRDKRHHLRSRLEELGFGSVAAGTWIAPAHVRDEAVDAISRSGLADFVQVFDADYRGYSDVASAVGGWWDVAGLQGMYRRFIEAHQPVLARWLDGDGSDGEAFVDYVRTLTAWRRLPYLDPGLPPDVLPSDWKGTEAAALFDRLRAVLGERAARHVWSQANGAAGR